MRCMGAGAHVMSAQREHAEAFTAEVGVLRDGVRDGNASDCLGDGRVLVGGAAGESL